MSETRYDIAIIGTGPAGISAAVTASIRNKKIILFGSRDLSPKIQKAHRIDNYPGLPEITGADLAKALSAHLEQMNIPITEEKVITAYSMGDYYAIQTTDGNYEAAAVILAGGVNFGKPLPGEEEFLGRGVSYCATCDAPLYRGRSVIVVGYNEEAESEANFLSEVAEKVQFVPMYKGEVHVNEAVEIITEKPQEIRGMFKADVLVTEAGEHPADGIFILRDSISPKQLVPGLELDGTHVAVNLQMETNLPGCFACGDITGKPYQYIKAAGQGNVAALAAAAYLDSLKK